MSDLDEFRKEKDRVFATDHASPLPHEARHDFHGLKYYPEDATLRLELTLEPATDVSEVRMGTSTGDEQVYLAPVRSPSRSGDSRPA